MSAERPRLVEINLDAVILATQPCSIEVIGCAWMLVAHCVERDMTIKRSLLNPRAPARLFGISEHRWAKLQAPITTLAGQILEASRVTTKYGRGSLPYALRMAVHERDGGNCMYCRVPVELDGFHVDHIHPVSRGGSDDLINLGCACAPCNLSKGAKTVAEWRAGQ